MKTPSHSLLFALACLLVIFTLTFNRPAQPAAALASEPRQDECSTDRSVSVSGAAVIFVVPDRALIQLGVQSNGATPELVQNLNFQAIQKVVNAVRALGVDAADIATDYLIVYPLYSSYDSLNITGYRIDNTVSITLRNIDLIDDVIITALNTGANQVQDVEMYTSELRAYRDQARELAMQAAGEKAGDLANAAGAKVGCVLTINENTWTQYYGSWRGGREAAAWAQNVVQFSNNPGEGSGELDDSPVNLGQIAVRAEINASYSLGN